MECYYRLFPNGFWSEFKALVLLAIPIMLTCLAEDILAPISLIFCGRLGKSELASAGLAVSIFHVAGFSIIMGLLTAALSIIFLCCLPCVAIYFCMEPLLLATGQPPHIAKGSSISQSLGFLTQALSLLVYIICSNMYRKTWNGILGEKDLAVQTILNNVESVVYVLFPLGFAIATTIRIGQFLGANDNVTPRSAACVGFIVVLAADTITVVLLTALRGEIPKMFSSDPGVIEMAKDYFPSMITFQFVDAINGINMGIVRGVGKQKIGAVVCCFCMYLIGGPAGLCFMFLTKLGVSGFWWGLSIGAFAQAVAYSVICVRIDWTKECGRAAKRTIIHFVGSTNAIEIENIDSAPEYGSRDGECAF
ncbi:unnamed protein product [Dibothriocephalus latus]|uniref:Multidrug and toxin extrusion protein n=1 Tax=Dibothriocephalus latus TaxID=60516 RepID=A0A3P6UGI7_DIBLA|nr:unnamed protein product [Dibothriocephalus latus]